ncbi:uncharacterized protein UTRI_04876_B [Ustilago trichophora]|uniref:Uncharacterized protein n=1 Tax=Ustilago trichophora TaxID=86804 RepID=A0A5C3EIF4_9BASI|nr:uncharacterized protein UTRI_04876_B [Ustilago trichophora]
MKLLVLIKLVAAMSAASSIIPSSAAPMLPSSPATTGLDGRAAEWWRQYVATEQHKNAPVWPSRGRWNQAELFEKLRPFQERLERLDTYRSWARRNPDTWNALTEQQRDVLSRPFFQWDESMMKTDFPGRDMLKTRLEQEKMLVSQVESVLEDVAMHLPDVVPRR